MGPHNALSIDSTVTRVHTVLISTGQNLRTFLVHHTLRLGADNVGVSSVARRTVTASPVVSALTESLPATLSETTGEDTVSVDTFVS